MDEKRAGEDPKKRHFRADRFSVSNGKYYYSTREGTLEGPFDSREEAERELAMFLRRHSGLDVYSGGKEKDKPGG
jgi:hypothetical protein